MSITTKICEFTKELTRNEFYDFYSLATIMASPICGDYVWVGGTLLNLKKMVRRLRITIMYPRFNVDYATAYTYRESLQELVVLKNIYPQLANREEKQSVAKLIKVFEILVTCLPNEVK
jgi:hypothetical protein